MVQESNVKEMSELRLKSCIEERVAWLVSGKASNNRTVLGREVGRLFLG